MPFRGLTGVLEAVAAVLQQARGIWMWFRMWFEAGRIVLGSGAPGIGDRNRRQEPAADAGHKRASGGSKTGRRTEGEFSMSDKL